MEQDKQRPPHRILMPRSAENTGKLPGTASTKRDAAADALIPELAGLSDDANWGQIWSRPGLDLRTRSLCVICSLLSLERYKYAYGHMRAHGGSASHARSFPRR
jgi:alkylhydroperoxidase/carboxymuconolactone decarboxylase family protein YurZ